MPESILFVVPYAPNLIRVRPYNLIRSLSERGNRVVVLTLWAGEKERESLALLNAYARRVISVRLTRWRSVLNVLGVLPTGKPLQSAYCWEPALARQLESLAATGDAGGPFDVVHVEHLRGATYGLALKQHLARLGQNVPVVWDSVDSISLLFRQAMVRARSPVSRAITRFELGRTVGYEGWLLGQFDAVVVTSSNDAQALRDLPTAPRDANVSVIRNGVDLEYFSADESVTREPATLILTGKMSYHANVTMALNFVQEIMPYIWAGRPDARVQVVGKDPPREIHALAADPRVTVTGTVSHLPPYLQRATVAVAPIAYGAGIQNKVLEAMACGTPTVASPQAISALDTSPGRDLLVAEGSEEFAQAVLKLLDDPALRQRVSRAGRAYVETYHDWAGAAAQLEAIYASARASST